MSLTHQQNADLAEDSYKNRLPREKPYEINGIAYKVLEHVDNKLNGYQGTIYQRVDTGEIVVAHRGTEFDQGPKAILQDGVLADGGMAVARTNAQANDAIELTGRAIEYAEKMTPRYGGVAPQVTVVGHSLGGCLAQISAHEFQLKGETFNAYGAVSLNRNIGQGGHDVLNHVMAGDLVSAAGQHYGQMRVYTTPKELAALDAAGYENNRSQWDARSPGAAVSASVDSHRMHNFLSVGGDKKPDVSVLADPATRQLAQQFAPMIDKYRADLADVRGLATVLARGPVGNAVDAYDVLRGPLPPGEAIRRQQHLDSALSWEESRGIADIDRLLPSRGTPYAPELTKPGGGISLPEYLPKSDEHVRPPLKHDETPRYRGMPLSGITPGHPDHALYAELKQALPTAISEDRLAQITVAAKVGGVRAGQLDGIHIDEQSLQVFVSGKIPGNRCCVDLATPPPTAQETLQRSEAFDQQQAQQLAQFQAQQQSVSAQTKSGPGMAFG